MPKDVDSTKKEEGKLLTFLYRTVSGRICLKILASRPLSKAVGAFLDSPLSCFLIGPFLKKNKIDMEEYLKEDYHCFNDFFCRRINPKKRPVDMHKEALISPCDGLLSVYEIKKDTVLPIKQSRYRISDLLGKDKVSREFRDGYCLVFRLCVNHYHRYCYLDGGRKGRNIFLPGQLHTVRPIALEKIPVFVRNCREYTIMDTDNFGKVAQIEVGAMLVGKIHNNNQEACFLRGQEKGRFLYGGSTIVVLLKKEAVVLRDDLRRTINQGIEHPVKMGEKIGRKKTDDDL